MNTYHPTVEYLYGLRRHGIKPGLDPTLAILKRLGNPHHRFVSFHVAGTNGKGSTAVMVAAVLQSAGHRVGLYTSPHLVEFRERIRVQGVMISDSRVIEMTHRIRLVAGDTLSLTFFEFTTAMAFQYFAEEQVDVAVIEVGLGGRFDATNVLDPLGLAITNIACDHEQYLGYRLSEIAYEKAGIIKKGSSVVVGPMAEAPRQVIEMFAAEQNADPHRWNYDFQITPHAEQKFDYHGPHWTLPDIRCALMGDHQIQNAACAVALLEIGALKGMKIGESAIRQGLAHVRWEGRLETVSKRPRILLDGAHNAAAAHVLVSFLAKSLRKPGRGRLILIVGMMRDKNHEAFLEALTPLANTLILTQASLSRAASVQELTQALPAETCAVQAIADPREAIAIAKKLAGSTDLICITGSLILVGELRECLLQSDYSSSSV